MVREEFLIFVRAEAASERHVEPQYLAYVVLREVTYRGKLVK